MTKVPRPYVGALKKSPEGVTPGQQVAEVEGDEVVVFIIGMRFNRLRDVRAWWPVFVGMPKMLKELEKHPEDGLLGVQSAFAGRTLITIQYWKSAEHLGRYAKAANRLHAPAWAAFNKHSAGTGSVGVFHETYVVPKDAIESRYANMPTFGLAKAFSGLSRAEHRNLTQAEKALEVTDSEYVEA